MAEALIKVDNVSKKFCRDLKRSLWYGVRDIASDLMGLHRGRTDSLRKDEFWAVKDVSFELKRGECLGLIGHNGAGKSTLLKLLNGLIKPDQGSITMKGRVGALIELGAGFNPVLSGRENVYVNGQLLGFSKQDINRSFNDIVEFSEIGDFIDMPVRNYSSGMKVRLGFAVAAQLEPDILLIDEVLAVGDMGFVLKCFNKMDSLMKNTAMIFVSHNIPQVARMASQLLLMSRGSIGYYGDDIPAGLTKYYDSYARKIGNFQGSDKVELLSVELESRGVVGTAEEMLTMAYGDDLTLRVRLNCLETVVNPVFWFAFYDKEQRVFAEVRNFSEQIKLKEIVGAIELCASIPAINFAQGVYSVAIGLLESNDSVRQTLFRYQSAIHFKVHGQHHGWAPVQLSPRWTVKA